MKVELRGALPAGRFLVAEGAGAALTAVLFAGFAFQRVLSYRSAGDDSGLGVLIIAIGFLIALLAGGFCALVFLVGRAVQRGSQAAWRAALALSVLQLLITVFVWPLALPLGVMGVVALVLLLLPETRAQCAAPPLLEESEP